MPMSECSLQNLEIWFKNFLANIYHKYIICVCFIVLCNVISKESHPLPPLTPKHCPLYSESMFSLGASIMPSICHTIFKEVSLNLMLPIVS